MQINPINEAAHNTAILTLTAERQELLYYREMVEKLTDKVSELNHAFGSKVTDLEQSEAAYHSERALKEDLQEDVDQLRLDNTQALEANKKIKGYVLERDNTIKILQAEINELDQTEINLKKSIELYHARESDGELVKICTQPMFRTLEGIVATATQSAFKMSDVVFPILQRLGYKIAPAEPATIEDSNGDNSTNIRDNTDGACL